jgi:hypothetical protein
MAPRNPVTFAVVRRLALALPDATENHHFDIPDIRVCNKIFVSFPKGGELVGLKCTPANVDALVSTDRETFSDLWRGRWLGVRLDRVELRTLQELIADAWGLAASKRMVAARTESQKQKTSAPVTRYGGRFTAKLFRYAGEAAGLSSSCQNGLPHARRVRGVARRWRRWSTAMRGRRAYGVERTAEPSSRSPSGCVARRPTETQ